MIKEKNMSANTMRYIGMGLAAATLALAVFLVARFIF